MSTNEEFIIPFLEQVISDIKHKKLSPKQIIECSRFYLNYTTDTNTNTFSYTSLDCLTAGITFYKTLTTALDVTEELQNEK
jgi:hypothetical protein